MNGLDERETYTSIWQANAWGVKWLTLKSW